MEKKGMEKLTPDCPLSLLIVLEPSEFAWWSSWEDIIREWFGRGWFDNIFDRRLYFKTKRVPPLPLVSFTSAMVVVL